ERQSYRVLRAQATERAVPSGRPAYQRRADEQARAARRLSHQYAWHACCHCPGLTLMMNDPARVSLTASVSGASACEMCTAEANIPSATVVVDHPRGGTVELAACDWCVRALRRLAATSGGHAVFALEEGGIPSGATRLQVPSGAR